MHGFHLCFRIVYPCSLISVYPVLFFTFNFFFFWTICIAGKMNNERMNIISPSQHQHFKCLYWIYGKVWNSITDSIHSPILLYAHSFIHSFTRNQLRAKSGWHSHKFPFPFPFPVYHIYFFEMHYRVRIHKSTYSLWHEFILRIWVMCWFCECVCIPNTIV